jgi:hypothetical protein
MVDASRKFKKSIAKYFKTTSFGEILYLFENSESDFSLYQRGGTISIPRERSFELSSRCIFLG